MTTNVSQLAKARMEKKGDARVRKTLENIRKAFHDLILLNDYEKLTVADLCKKASIGRKTFYMYFSSLDDLMEAMLADMAKEYISRIKGLQVPQDLHEITLQFYLFSEEQGLFYEKLINNRSYQLLGGRLIGEFISGAWQDSQFYCSLSPIFQELLLCFIYGAGSAIYKQWVMSGKKILLEDMVNFSTSLLMQGIEWMEMQRSGKTFQEDK